MKKIKYYLFVIRWMWANRDWDETRQKYKAMDKDWSRHQAGKPMMYLR